MSYNGSGTFNINTAGQPVVTGTVISSTAFNALTADLATGLSTAITKDGQTTTTARIAFAQGVSSTLVTDATSATTGSIITAGGISCQKALWVGTTSRHVGATQFDAAITYGGVTLSNAVTGTGNMVLSASPTLTGTLAAAAATFSGQTVVGTSGAPGGFTPYLYANGLRISGGDTTNTIYQATGALVLSTGSSAAISFAPNVTTVATINGSGLGIGMTPSNILDITQTTNGLANIGLTNGSTGTSAAAFSKYTNSASSSYVGVFGGSYTTSGINRQDGLIVQAGGTGGITLNTATSQPIYFTINNSEVARFDTSGRLGIGTTNPVRKLMVSNGGAEGFEFGPGEASGYNYLLNYNRSTSVYVISRTYAASYEWLIGGTEKMRLGSDGSFLVGGTTNVGAGNVYISGGSGPSLLIGKTGASLTTNGFTWNNSGGGDHVIASSGNGIQVNYNGASGTPYWAQFTYNNGAAVGSITFNSVNTAFNTSSDSRLKTNIEDADDAGAIIDALRVRKWDWIATGTHEAFGFVAQEEHDVYSPAVTVGDGGGSVTTPWMRDDSKLVPLLVKEIQSLRQRLAAAGIA